MNRFIILKGRTYGLSTHLKLIQAFNLLSASYDNVALSFSKFYIANNKKQVSFLEKKNTYNHKVK